MTINLELCVQGSQDHRLSCTRLGLDEIDSIQSFGLVTILIFSGYFSMVQFSGGPAGRPPDSIVRVLGVFEAGGT